MSDKEKRISIGLIVGMSGIAITLCGFIFSGGSFVAKTNATTVSVPALQQKLESHIAIETQWHNDILIEINELKIMLATVAKEQEDAARDRDLKDRILINEIHKSK